jgi:exopolysaccharide production protein ExoZ
MFSALAIVGRIPGVEAGLGNYAFFVDPMILEFVLGVIVERCSSMVGSVG